MTQQVDGLDAAVHYRWDASTGPVANVAELDDGPYAELERCGLP